MQYFVTGATGFIGKRLVKKLLARRGSTAIEYALVAALAGIAALGGIQAVGANTNSMWADTVAAIVAALTGA